MSNSEALEENKLTLSKRWKLDSPKLEVFADHNFKFDDN